MSFLPKHCRPNLVSKRLKRWKSVGVQSRLLGVVVNIPPKLCRSCVMDQDHAMPLILFCIALKRRHRILHYSCYCCTLFHKTNKKHTFFCPRKPYLLFSCWSYPVLTVWAYWRSVCASIALTVLWSLDCCTRPMHHPQWRLTLKNRVSFYEDRQCSGSMMVPKKTIG